VFPEQAANWEWFSELIKKEDREIKVLNLFAYTGGATVAAAKAGAFVCHCDASKGMVARAKENANLSDVPQDRIRYIVDDCLKFVEREIRRGKKYDGIIMDPPSYGRGSNGEVWQMEQMADELVKRTAMLLSDEPLFFLLNSYTTGLSASSCGCLLELYVKNRFGGKVENDELGLMITDKGMALPCGAASRWTRE
jgi:23S rRNA (cytosine1962-C5)-methyltransferase